MWTEREVPEKMEDEKKRHSVWDNPDSKEFGYISYSDKKVTGPLKTDSHYNLNF